MRLWRLLAAALSSRPCLLEGVLLGRQSQAADGHLTSFGQDRARSVHAPPLAEFERIWKDLRRNDSVAVPEGELPRIVVGIFSTLNTADASFRSVIRSTLASQPLVCTAADFEEGHAERTARCSIFATFVVGQSLGNSECDRRPVEPGSEGLVPSDEEDLTVLPIRENLNCGKTKAWFDFAVRRYPWATHIGKMDMDAYMHVSKLVARLRNLRTPCPHVFGGKSMTCPLPGPGKELAEFCPPRACLRWPFLLPRSYDFLGPGAEPARPGAECWHFMQGGFYFLTSELTRRVLDDPGPLDDYITHGWPEDIAFGRAVNVYARKHNICVAAMNLLPGHVVKHMPHRPDGR